MEKRLNITTLVELYRMLIDNNWNYDNVEIIKDKNYKNIERAYQVIQESDGDIEDEVEDEMEFTHIEICENDYNRAAKAAIEYLKRVEPILTSNKNIYGVLRAMPDSAGTKGDVRDIDFEIFEDKEHKKLISNIGISCKNNHEAVKHPRITEDPDFARVWTGGEFSCSKSFTEKIEEIFNKIDAYAEKYCKWSEVEDKMDEIYYPIIKLFAKEIKRLGTVNEKSSIKKQEEAKLFTKAFFEYMFGTQDFYNL